MMATAQELAEAAEQGRVRASEEEQQVAAALVQEETVEWEQELAIARAA